MHERDTLIKKMLRLDQLLQESEGYWRPQPFKQARPAWCTSEPQLTARLLSLSDDDVRQLAAQPQSLLTLLGEHIPVLKEIAQLLRLAPSRVVALRDLGPHFHSAIPGRKWQQIERFAQSIGRVEAPLIEWCGGKGHLGRLLAAQWQQPVETIEHDTTLCDEGELLARRARVRQRFHRLDALGAPSARLLASHHAVALHACGELHRTLLREAVKAGAEAFDIAPCCYYVGAGDRYRPFSSGLKLRLGRDDLRLAVTETVTAAAREVERRDREMAWKLGYELLRRERCGELEYLPIKPIEKRWLGLDFAAFCGQLAQREGRELPPAIDWAGYEAAGWQRQREVMRLSLVRAAFRRGLELWLVLDMANFIATHGYAVEITTFCDRSLTPRNILLSARRKTAA